MNRAKFLLLGLIATTTLGGIAHAAPKKGKAKTPAKAKPKPVAKKPANNAIRGMTQMAGDNGQLGVTYTLGKESPLNFTLKRVEWSAAGINIGTATFAPKLDEKLMVLHYTVHNPNNYLRNYDWGELKFTAVDAASNNHESIGPIGRATDSEALAIELKPAQKVDGYTAIVLPARGNVPKLIVTLNNNSAGVLRYDLRGKVQALAAPFADASDTSGSTALGEIPASLGTAYPSLNFDIKPTAVAYAPGPFGDLAAEEGKRFLVATVAMRNRTGGPIDFDGSMWTANLQTADGEKVEPRGVYKSARNEFASGNLKPGAEYSIRFIFDVPNDQTAKTLYIAEGESRVYAFDVTNAK